MNLPPLAIVGPTAVGKSELALTLAQRTGAEIVSIDSMQVYRGMDIGTAKPTRAERESVPHHLIDLLEPSEDCSVAWFQDRAQDVRADLDRREVPALLVGGTGLYHRAIVDGLDIPGRWPEIRRRLELDPDTAGLYAQLEGLDPVAATRMDPANRRRIIRALEVCLGSGVRFSDHGPGLTDYPPTPVCLVGLACERDRIGELVDARLRLQVEAGFLEEVERLDRALRDAGRSWSTTASQALGYRELLGYLRGGCSLADALEATRLRTRRFAIRQLRWFRRDPRIVWFDRDDPQLADLVESEWRKLAGHLERGSLG